MSTQRGYYKGQPTQKQVEVFYPGTDAILEGIGLVYLRSLTGSDTGQAATEPWGARGSYVGKPSAPANLGFAGVAAKSYPAAPQGQFIQIFEPGSYCNVAVGLNQVVNVGRMCCSTVAGQEGRFFAQGLPGKGSAVPEQTVTPIIASNLTGTASLASAGLVVTDSGATFVVSGVIAGDVMVILGGKDNGTQRIVQGVYTVASVDSATQVTLATVANNATGAVLEFAYVIYHVGNPKCWAYLEDGPESGLLEYLSPKSAAASNAMVGGTTLIVGGHTVATVSTHAVAAGTINGMRKLFRALGTLTTAGWRATFTNGLKQDGTTALVSLTFDALDELGLLENINGIWQAVRTQGGVTVA